MHDPNSFSLPAAPPRFFSSPAAGTAIEPTGTAPAIHITTLAWAITATIGAIMVITDTMVITGATGITDTTAATTDDD